MVALLLAASLALAQADGAGPPDGTGITELESWKIDVPADIVWWHATPAGVLVLGTRASLMGVEGPTGRTLWRRDDLRDADRMRLEVLPRSPYAVLALGQGIRAGAPRIVIDVRTGREVWDTSVLGMAEVHADLYVPSLDALLISGRVSGGDRVLLADLASGRRILTLDVPAPEAATFLSGPWWFDSETTLVGWTRAGLVRYGLGSGKAAWRSAPPKARTAEPCIPLRGDSNGPPERKDPRPLPAALSIHLGSDGQLFVAQGTVLQAVDAATGRPLWGSPPALCGRVAQVEQVGDGILVRTMPEIAGNDELVMLDGGTGAVRWRFPRFDKGVGSRITTMFQSDIPLSNLLLADGAAWVLAGRNLFRVDLRTGSGAKLGATWVNQVNRMQLVHTSRGFMVVGQQELDWLDTRGNSVGRVRYEPLIDLEQGLTVSGTALKVAEGAAPAPGSLRFGPDYGPAMERYTQEFRASSRFDSLVFVLAEFVDGFNGRELVAIGVNGGRPARRIPFKGMPLIEIDPLRRMIFVIEGRTIRGFEI